MSKSKYLFPIIGFCLFLFIFWYLAIKSYDYRTSFQIKMPLGIASHSIESWASSENEKILLDEKSSINHLSQIIDKSSEGRYEIEWELEFKNDSVTTVHAYTTSLDKTPFNRLEIPFTNTDVQKFSVNTATRLAEFLKELKKKFKVEINGVEDFGIQNCACINSNTPLINKPRDMIALNSEILGFLKSNNLEFKGYPYVMVNTWDKKNESINYDFCFPIAEDSFPPSTTVKFRSIETSKFLKATFYGNYSLSHLAWYALLGVAYNKSLEIEEIPTEVFYNDPMIDSNEKEWKAEIFLPLKNQNE